MYCIKADGDHAVNAVSKRYCRVLSGATLSLAAFSDIDRLASTDSTRVWAEEEECTRKEHIQNVTAMDIYDIRMERHEFDHSTLLCLENWLQTLLVQKFFLN